MNEATRVALTVRQYVQSIQEGKFTSEKLATECLDRIDATESNIGAWVHLDREFTLSQAQNLDEIRKRGQPVGDLHGIPVGIKDIFDTSDFPTERGTSIYTGRQSGADSATQ